MSCGYNTFFSSAKLYYFLYNKAKIFKHKAEILWTLREACSNIETSFILLLPISDIIQWLKLFLTACVVATPKFLSAFVHANDMLTPDFVTAFQVPAKPAKVQVSS